MQMQESRSFTDGSADGPFVEKLIEYRTAHHSAYSEAASYHTNHPARVQFRFENPIICRLTAGEKIMTVGESHPFRFGVSDVMYVPPGVGIDIDLSAASPAAPIECDCFEIEAGRMDNLIGKLNESLSVTGKDASVALNWDKYAVFSGDEAEDLRLDSLMSLFRGNRGWLADTRIEARIDETVLALLHMRARDLLTFDKMTDLDNGIMAAARLIRNNLSIHLSTDMVAQAACMSSSTLHRQFQKHFGTSPRKFANQLRISEAKRQLRVDNSSIEKVSANLAFSDVSHFARVFRRSVGESPAAYRKRRDAVSAPAMWVYDTKN